MLKQRNNKQLFRLTTWAGKKTTNAKLYETTTEPRRMRNESNIHNLMPKYQIEIKPPIA